MNDGHTRPILVGVDGSPESAAAARWASTEAALRQCPLHLACVYFWPAPLMPLTGHPAELTEDSLRQDAERVVADLAGEVRDQDPGVRVSASAIIGIPAHTLIGLSERVDMLVVGHRGHGGFGSLRLGSVAANVAAHASCPVAVVRSPASRPAAGTVLVGVDGPASSDHVLGFAFDEASRRGAALTAVTAWERPVWPAGPDAADWMASAAHRLQSALLPWQEKYPDVTVRQLVTPERPAAALLDAARQADLLVIGSRGHGGFAGLLLGSVGQQAIHYAPGPVVVVR
jgi:nucleotide-binding universal stress UspA family protein